MKKRMLFAAAIAVACIGAADPSYRVEPLENGAVVFNAHRDVTHEDCYNDPSHDAADLCAQWRAAKAAERSADSAASSNWIAYVSMVLSAIGMVGVFGTIWFTKESLSEARKATAAAQHAVSEARRIGEAQVRCYLSIEKVVIRFRSKDKNPVVKICVKNSGQSPALSANRAISISYRDSSAGFEGIRETTVEEFDAIRSWALAPNSTTLQPFTSYEFPLNDLEQKLLDKAALGATIRILIKAKDVFGEDVMLAATFAVKGIRYDDDMTMDHIAHI